MFATAVSVARREDAARNTAAMAAMEAERGRVLAELETARRVNAEQIKQATAAAEAERARAWADAQARCAQSWADAQARCAQVERDFRLALDSRRSEAIALLAIEHNAPVAVGVACRVGPGFRYEIRCADIIDPAEFRGTADDARLLTQRYTSALEALIRQDPTQYLWLHRRWKHQPKPRRREVESPSPAGA